MAQKNKEQGRQTVIDPDGSSLQVNDDGLARSMGMPLFRLILEGGEACVEFKDGSGLRRRIRGTDTFCISVDGVVDFLLRHKARLEGAAKPKVPRPPPTAIHGKW